MSFVIYRKGESFTFKHGFYKIHEGCILRQKEYNGVYVNQNLYVAGDYYNASTEGLDPYRLLALSQVKLLQVREIPVYQLSLQLNQLEKLIYILNLPLETKDGKNRVYYFLKWLEEEKKAAGLLTQEQIGLFCGASRVTIQRKIKELRRLRLVSA